VSYILDALKKSEQERNLGRVKTLDTINADTASPTLRLVVTGVLVALMFAALFGGFVWYFRSEIQNLLRSELDNVGTEINVRSPAKEPPEVRVIDSTRVITTTPVDAVNEQQPVQRIVDTSVVVNVESTTPVVQHDPSIPLSVAELPTEIVKSLPTFSISVLSFSADPERRFVMLNGQIVKEQDFVSDQIELIKIEKDRLVLAFNGQHFYIRP
jgi:general secretion pathway protein B